MNYSSLLLEAAKSAFIWQEHTGEVIATALLSMVPMYEGRYALTTGVGMGLPLGFAYLIAFVASSVPIPFILLLLRPILDWFYTLPIKPVQKFAAWLEKRSARKREKMHADNQKGMMAKIGKRVSAETLELIALYVFVAIPLPGTGIWSGTAIATLFEMPRGKSALAVLLGNATACLIMLLMTVGVKAIF